jgi:hypothetical protein
MASSPNKVGVLSPALSTCFLWRWHPHPTRLGCCLQLSRHVFFGDGILTQQGWGAVSSFLDMLSLEMASSPNKVGVLFPAFSTCFLWRWHPHPTRLGLSPPFICLLLDHVPGIVRVVSYPVCSVGVSVCTVCLVPGLDRLSCWPVVAAPTGQQWRISKTSNEAKSTH